MHLDNWLTFTLGAIIVNSIPPQAIQECQLLFLNVLFIRYQFKGQPDGEELAYKQLDAALISNVYFSWDNNIDQREMGLGDTDGSQDGSDWKDVESKDEEYDDVDDKSKDEMDEDYVEDDDPVSDEDAIMQDLNSDSNDEAEADNKPQHLPHFVHSHTGCSALPHNTSPPSETPVDQLPFLWAQHIDEFFFADTNEDNWDLEPVVTDYVAMKKLSTKQYWSAAFLRTLEYICLPRSLLETSHPDVEESFRWHDWKLAYAELICNWVKESISLQDYEKKINGFNPDKIYPLLMELLLVDNDPSTHHKLMAETLDSWLSVVIRKTSDYRTFMQNLKDELYQPLPKPDNSSVSDSDSSNSDTEWDVAAANTSNIKPSKGKSKLQGQDDKPRCLQMSAAVLAVQVVLIKNTCCKHLTGGALTCAQGKMYLKPKPAPKPQNGSTFPPKLLPKIQYYHPFKGLHMKLVQFQKTVYKWCGKDIVRFVYKHSDGTNEFVGGAARETFMVLMHLTTVDIPDDIKALFCEAVDADALVEVGKTIYLGLSWHALVSQTSVWKIFLLIKAKTMLLVPNIHVLNTKKLDVAATIAILLMFGGVLWYSMFKGHLWDSLN
ncbi:hypothetical protein B0H19DRAFT_1058220 [Mycena capillaripes]|nr:hypothetical protein B0H19DRAFT_1058220 [Mycena capillaripes]